ncbi:HTH-type transcriptional activator CmpR [Pelotomaculum schinkii]|uniref:HTH-type transcriptional activator CmpR n=1 Tax=Pelotomaculum schinkii TaxID=78350 RepID=A0A4Y7R922_9FIRM|nr:LysR family transcriptional regulator [Pelotomaculum schinkii]TEB05444.1 HTH-type transcriptional activator CmpR [Pelotomaculum schinkii]
MSEINLYQLKVFYSVARHLGYSKAGEELALSQPAVSRQVAALEKSLGLELFVQRGRHVELTDVGRSLFDYADRIFDLAVQAERAMSQFKDLERGHVLIGASTTIGSYILPQVLQAFHERFPHIDISLRLGNSATIEQLVTNRDVDLGLVGDEVKNPAMHVETYFRDELVMIISPEHHLNNKKKVLVEDLERETLIWREKGSATRALIERFLNNSGVVFKNYIEIGDTEATKRLVTAKMGIAFVSRYAITLELSAGILNIIDSSKFVIPRYFYVISAKYQHHVPTVLALLNFIHKCFPQGKCPFFITSRQISWNNRSVLITEPVNDQ